MAKHYDNAPKFVPAEGKQFAVCPRDGSKKAVTVAMGMRKCGMTAYELSTHVGYDLSYTAGSQISGKGYLADDGYGCNRNTETVGDHLEALKEHGAYNAGKNAKQEFKATAEEAAKQFWESLPEGMRKEDAHVTVFYLYAAGERIVPGKGGHILATPVKEEVKQEKPKSTKRSRAKTAGKA